MRHQCYFLSCVFDHVYLHVSQEIYRKIKAVKRKKNPYNFLPSHQSPREFGLATDNLDLKQNYVM